MFYFFPVSCACEHYIKINNIYFKNYKKAKVLSKIFSKFAHEIEKFRTLYH